MNWGREYDRESHLLYVRNRWMAPGLGRFISEDPIRLAGGINLYAYAENNPADLTDPFGLEAGDHCYNKGQGLEEVMVICVKTSGKNENPSSRGSNALRGSGDGGGPGKKGKTAPVLSCSAAREDLRVTTAMDATVLLGVGITARAGYLALSARGAAGTLATVPRTHDQAGRFLLGKHFDAFGNYVSESVRNGAVSGAAASFTFGEYIGQLPSRVPPGSRSSWRDLAPGFASWDAHSRYLAACGG